MQIRVRNETRQTVVAESAEVAETSAQRRKGLLKNQSLEPGKGLWIVPCEAIHSFGMKFAIDVLFLDRNKRVRKIRPHMIPRRISACLPAHSVLELPTGTIRATRTETGDQLRFERV